MDKNKKIEKDESNGVTLSGSDIIVLLIIWASVTGMIWSSKEPIIDVICLIAAYYLSKFIILKTDK